MTYKEIFIKAISQAAGKPEKEVLDIWDQFQKAHPGGQWDKTIPEHEAEALLAKFKADSPAIIAWLESGRRSVERFGSGTIH